MTTAADDIPIGPNQTPCSATNDTGIENNVPSYFMQGLQNAPEYISGHLFLKFFSSQRAHQVSWCVQASKYAICLCLAVKPAVQLLQIQEVHAVAHSSACYFCRFLFSSSITQRHS